MWWGKLSDGVFSKTINEEWRHEVIINEKI